MVGCAEPVQPAYSGTTVGLHPGRRTVRRDILMADAPAHIPELAEAVHKAAGQAIRMLYAEHPEDFCLFALVTSGEGYRPYLAATVHGDDRWDFTLGPYDFVFDDILAQTEEDFAARGELHLMNAADAALEHERRLASLEEALRRIDADGLFGTGDDRARVLLLVATMPPDDSDAGFARRLNPRGPLLDTWLDEAAEGV